METFTYRRDAKRGVIFYAGETRIGSWQLRKGMSWTSLEMRAANRVYTLNGLSSRIGSEAAIREAREGRA